MAREGAKILGETVLKGMDEPRRILVTVSPEGLGCKPVGSQASLVLLTGEKTAFIM